MKKLVTLSMGASKLVALSVQLQGDSSFKKMAIFLKVKVAPAAIFLNVKKVKGSSGRHFLKC
jgi:hypothetical protein